MPWLPFYATQEDLRLVSDILTVDKDLALLVNDRNDVWKALAEYPLIMDGRYPLWHVHGAPLPLMPHSVGDSIGEINDPFEGWRQLRTNAGYPYFGNATSVFHLTLRYRASKPESSFGLSGIEWVGGRYAVLGNPLPDATKKRWAKLVRQFAKAGPRVPRGFLNRNQKLEVIALPQALHLLESGAKGDLNPL